MATTAKIAITNTDKTLTSIFLHWDGYLDHAGEILPTHYDTEVKVRELIELGDLNSLAETLASCCFEHRDKGADWDNCQPTTYRSFAHFMQERNDADYLYIYQDGKWFYHDNKDEQQFLQSMPQSPQKYDRSFGTKGVLQLNERTARIYQTERSFFSTVPHRFSPRKCSQINQNVPKYNKYQSKPNISPDKFHFLAEKTLLCSVISTEYLNEKETQTLLRHLRHQPP